MKLWASLYLMTWLVFVAFWLALTPVAPPVPKYLHAVLGAGIVALGYANYLAIRATTAPGRIKRTVRATFAFSVAIAPLGVLQFFGVGASLVLFGGITVEGAVGFFHFVGAGAIFAQAAAAGIAYDMWEDREFERSTAPGVIPPMPAP